MYTFECVQLGVGGGDKKKGGGQKKGGQRTTRSFRMDVEGRDRRGDHDVCRKHVHSAERLGSLHRQLSLSIHNMQFAYRMFMPLYPLIPPWLLFDLLDVLDGGAKIFQNLKVSSAAPEQTVIPSGL